MTKRKVCLGILVIALVFGLTVAGCNDDSTDNGNQTNQNDGGGSSGGGSSGGGSSGGGGSSTGDTLFSQTYTNMVIVHSTQQPNTENYNNLLSTLGTGEWEAKVTGGTLSLKLGTPYTSVLYPLEDMGSGITVSNPQVKGCDSKRLTISSSQKKYIYYCNYNYGTNNSYPKINGRLVYVNDNVDITGTKIEDGITTTHEQHLKKGWNIVIHTQTNATTERYEVESTPSSDIKWYIINQSL